MVIHNRLFLLKILKKVNDVIPTFSFCAQEYSEEGI